MAIKGLSKPTFGKYVNTSGTISYTDGVACGHAISYTFDPSIDDDNPLYGDNMIVEHDFGHFKNGTLTLGTSELPDTVAAMLLGLTKVTKTIGEGTGALTVDQYFYDDDSAAIDVGIGFIEEHQVDDVDYYKAIVLPRCKKKFDSRSATTRGETIDWQTPSITFSVERSEDAKHSWFIESKLLSSEADAQTYLNAVLGVSAG